MRILIVEDDKHIRRILESLLAHDASLVARGPEVVIAQDGKEGLEALDAHPKFDLVVSDLLMPRMDGFQFCRELRKHKNGGDVPLIVTSAIYKDQQTINRLHTETGAEFFSKPFQVRELMSAVRRLLGEPERPGGPVATAPPTKPVGVTTAQVQALAQSPSGMLADRPMPRLILDLFEQKATGTLTLQRGKVRKEISLLHGTPVTVNSNLRTETLGHFLVARGVLDETRHREALGKAQAGHERLGHVLIELKYITEKELLKQLGAQMRAKITNMLRWKEGGWSFALGQPPTDRLQTPVEAPRIVFAGLQKSAHVDEIAQDLAKLRGRVALTLRAERHREDFVRTFGAGGLETMGRRPLLEDVIAGGDLSSMLVQLDALLICGMAEIEPASVGRRGPTERTDPAALERIVREAPSMIANPVAPQKNLYDELFGGEEVSEVGPLPGAEPKPAQPVPDEEDDDESGVMQLPTGPAAAAAAYEISSVAVVAKLDPHVEALRKEILTEYLAIHGKDHYQVLRIVRDAQPEDIAQAYATIGKRFRLERFANLDLGRDYARLEEIHQILRQAFETLTSRDQREAYDRVLSARQKPSHAALDADLLAQEAQLLLSRGDALLARTKLIDAVGSAPDQADYHALLAWAVFVAEGGTVKGAPPSAIQRAAGLSWTHLEQALAIDSDSLDGHDFAGRIASAAGDDERAVSHLERVLDADPRRADALTALEAALTRRNDWKRLERQYRKLIHRLGDQHDPERALRLWWRLAELYRTRLDDRGSARVAYEIAAKLAPDDPRPREALAKLHGEDPASWQKAAEALRESWRLAPSDPAPGQSLYKLHSEAERWDAAFLAASSLACRGLDDDASGPFYRRYRPRFLQRAAGPIAPELQERLRHPDDERDLAQLFTLVFSEHAPVFTLEELGVTAADRVINDEQPEPFARVLRYIADELGVQPPPVYRRADFGAEAHVGAMTAPVLLVGPQALAAQDRIALGFRLGRALTFLWPSRAVVSALPSRELKTLLLAAVTLVQPGLKTEDPDGQIERTRAQLAGANSLARELAPVVERLLKNPQGTLNLSRYGRSLARTADRFGLLLSGDLATATRIAGDAGAPGAAEDLLDFALSAEYLEAREALGLSIAV